MRSVGSRELKSKLSEVLRKVREEGEKYIVAQPGRPIARIIPEVTNVARPATLEEIWAEMDLRAEEIGRAWPKSLSAAQALNTDRSDLSDA